MKSDEFKFNITIEQMAFFTNAVVERDRLRREMRDAEIALRGKKEALRRYQAICEKMKNDKKDDLETTVQMLVDAIGWKPTTKSDMKCLSHICRERGMSSEVAGDFLRWHSARKWNAVSGETTVDDLITRWIDAMND